MGPTKSRFQGGVAAVRVMVLLMLVTVAAAGEPVKVQAAQRAFNDAYRQEDWSRAVDVGLDLVRMVPNDTTIQYNLACVYALVGDADSALHWLGRAAAGGFSNLSLLDGDSDLDAVRDRPGYSRVRGVVAKNERRHKKDVSKRAAASPLLIVTPDNLDEEETVPLVIVFHGYGDRARNYPRFWSGAAGEFDAILAIPQGLRSVGKGFGWGSVDEADAILQYTLDEVDRRYAIDRDRIIITGFSQGGFIALALGTRYPDVFAGVIPMAGPYIPDIDAPPTAREGDPRYYFMVGTRDRVAKDMRRAAKDFESAGFNVRLRILPGTGHNFPEDYNRELTTAMRWVLKP